MRRAAGSWVLPTLSDRFGGLGLLGALLSLVGLERVFYHQANSMIRDISFNSNSANASKSKAVMVFTSILLE